MGEMTIRDEIWTLVLIKTIRQGKVVRAGEIADKIGCSKRTAQNTLNAMASGGFIKKSLGPNNGIRFLPADNLKSTASLN
jgi:Mn-dependent DtxR family transcriptional regulator